MRRFQPLDPSTLLIDEDQSVPTNCVPQVIAQTFDLRRRIDVPRKQDERPRISVPEEGSLAGRQLGA